MSISLRQVVHSARVVAWCGLAVAVVAAIPVAAGSIAPPTVQELLAKYSRAIDDPGAPPLDRYVNGGTLTGEGLIGTFASWHDGAQSRDDQILGPRSEAVYDDGTHIVLRDSNGNVRELRGVLLRRARTERLISSGAFVRDPSRSVYHGTATVGTRPAYLLDVTAPGGQPETLYLDAATGLPDRIAYDDDDGRSTIDLSDWRSVAGHRFAFHSVISNGDRAYDLTLQATSFEPNATIAPETFAPPRSRTIEMAGPQTLPFALRDGHLYLPVRIHGATYNFLVDTGSANVVVDERVAHAAGLHEEGVLQASGTERTGGLHVARLDELQIGEGRLRDLIVTTLDLGGATNGVFRIDGILGFPFFAASTVQIDYAKGTITFGPPGSLTPSGAKLDLELDRAIPETSLHINGDLQGRFVVDTGDAAEMLLYRPFVDQNPGIVPITSTARRSYGVGGATSSYRSTVDRLEIGGIALYHTEVDVMLATSGAFADRFDAGNIGLGVLKNFVLTFDDSAAALYVQRGAQFDDGRSRVTFGS